MDSQACGTLHITNVRERLCFLEECIFVRVIVMLESSDATSNDGKANDVLGMCQCITKR